MKAVCGLEISPGVCQHYTVRAFSLHAPVLKNDSLPRICSWSCSLLVTEYTLAIASFDSLFSRAGLKHLGKGWIVRVVTPQLEDKLTGLTGSSTQAETGNTDLQLTGRSVANCQAPDKYAVFLLPNAQDRTSLPAAVQPRVYAGSIITRFRLK